MHLREKLGIALEPQIMQWALLDDLTGRVTASGEQHNLVLSQAANTLFAQHGLADMTLYACVGTGNAAPAVGQTGLVAEVSRTNTVPAGDSDSVTRISPGVYDVRRVRQFSAAQIGGLNLTEWGFSPLGTAAANLAHRELFRDGSNNPVTITPTLSQSLRLIKIDRLTLGPAVAVSGSINIAGIGNLTGRLFCVAGNSAAPFYQDFSELETIERLIKGAAIAFAPLVNRVAESYTSFAQISAFAPGVAAYAANSKTRATNSLVLGQNDANQVIHGVTLGYTGPSLTAAGVIFQFDVGQEFTKTNLNQLTLDPWTVSWT